MVCVAQVIGRKDTGKTAVLERVTKVLRTQGYKVLVIKSSHHALDLQGKDTFRLKSSGADYVVFKGPDGLTVFTEDPELLDHVKADVVLIEGVSAFNAPIRFEITDPSEVDSIAAAMVRALMECLKISKESYNFRVSDVLRSAKA